MYFLDLIWFWLFQISYFTVYLKTKKCKYELSIIKIMGDGYIIRSPPTLPSYNWKNEDTISTKT